MQTATRILLAIATLGSFAMIEHYGYEYAKLQGCVAALITDNQIPPSAIERLTVPMNNWCEVVLQNDN
jgi:hypothetical protein